MHPPTKSTIPIVLSVVEVKRVAVSYQSLPTTMLVSSFFLILYWVGVTLAFMLLIVTLVPRVRT